MDGWVREGGREGREGKEEDVGPALYLIRTKWEQEQVHLRLWERGGAFLAGQCS